MLLLVSSLVLCACANGLAVGENTAAPSAPVYKKYAGFGSYFVDPFERSWSDASKMCKMFNGHLAFPETALELAVLKSILVEHNVTDLAYIGFHDLYVEGKYVTVQGKALSSLEYAVPWAPGQPNGGTIDNCGALGTDGIYDYDCSSRNPSICEERDPLSEGGFLGYERIGPYGLFKMVAVYVTWPDALEFCREQGAHLWIVNSAEELAAVYDHYDPMWNFWIGAHHLYANGFFLTIFDDTLEEAGYSTWDFGQPGGNNTEMPYVLVTDKGMANWLKDSLQYFVCEYNPSY